MVSNTDIAYCAPHNAENKLPFIFLAFSHQEHSSSVRFTFLLSIVDNCFSLLHTFNQLPDFYRLRHSSRKKKRKKKHSNFDTERYCIYLSVFVIVTGDHLDTLSKSPHCTFER